MPLAFEIMVKDRDQERLALNYADSLARIGVEPGASWSTRCNISGGGRNSISSDDRQLDRVRLARQ